MQVNWLKTDEAPVNGQKDIPPKGNLSYLTPCQ